MVWGVRIELIGGGFYKSSAAQTVGDQLVFRGSCELFPRPFKPFFYPQLWIVCSFLSNPRRRKSKRRRKRSRRRTKRKAIVTALMSSPRRRGKAAPT